MSTIAVGFGSATTEFKSRYPNLHMPAYPVSNTDLVTPGHADALLDGEFLLRDSNGELARPAGNAAGLTTPGENFACSMSHGNPGRSDHQVGEHIPWVLDDDFEIVTRLHSGNRTAGAVPPVVNSLYQLAIHSISLPYPGAANAVAHVGKVCLEVAGAGTPFVARCLEVGDNGWSRFFIAKGTTP